MALFGGPAVALLERVLSFLNQLALLYSVLALEIVPEQDQQIMSQGQKVSLDGLSDLTGGPGLGLQQFVLPCIKHLLKGLPGTSESVSASAGTHLA
jgi:hypothetical protein